MAGSHRRVVGPVVLLLALPSLALLTVGTSPAGAAASYSMNPTTLDFGTVAVGATKTIDVTVTNTGDASSTPNFSGGAPLDPDNFGGAQNCAGRTFAPGDTCTFSYVFKPQSPGPHNSSTSVGIDTQNFAITLLGSGESTTTTTTTTTRPTTTTRSSGSSSGGSSSGGGVVASPGSAPTTVASAAGLSVTVTDEQVSAGDEQSATARGFKPEELVSAVMQPGDVDLGSRVADGQGVARFAWNIPGDAASGTYAFTATGATSGPVSASFAVDQGDDSGTSSVLIGVLVAVGLLLIAGIIVLVYQLGRRRTGPDASAP